MHSPTSRLACQSYPFSAADDCERLQLRQPRPA
jgi:hypothetical protein